MMKLRNTPHNGAPALRGRRFTAAGMLVAAFAGITAASAGAAGHEMLQSPAEGVVCDAYVCADRWGLSDALTAQYLGEEKGRALTAQGEIDRTVFTFADGITCDVAARMCHKRGTDGEDGRSQGTADPTTTRLLFGE